jgi:hypothetical protein
MGQLTGFAAGLDIKAHLLALEGASPLSSGTGMLRFHE